MANNHDLESKMEEKQKTKLRNLKVRDIFAFSWAHWRKHPIHLASATVFMCLATLMDIAIPVYSGKIVDGLATGGVTGKEAALWAVAMFAGLSLMHHLLRVAGLYFWANMACDIMKKIVNDGIYKVSRFSTDWHANSFAGSTIRKITRGKWAFDAFGDTLYMGLFPALMVVTGITILQALHWPVMGLVFLVTSIVYIVVSTLLAIHYVAPKNREFVDQDSKVGAVLADTITCNSVVKAFGSEELEDKTVRKSTTKWRTTIYQLWMRGVHTDMIQSLMLTVMLFVVFSLAIHYWSIGKATIGDFSFVMSSYFMVYGYIRGIGQQIRHLQKSINEMEDVVEFASQDLGISDKENAKDLIVPKGGIAFNNVTFKYDNQHDAVYNALSVQIKPGEKLGLVGHSGSGKSTFVKLLQRLYDIDEGQIIVDGQDISDVTQSSLRQEMSIVPQDPILFHRSLADNIAYGRQDASLDEIKQAAKLANASLFIDSLPEGYETMVGERGVKLSGGERQRVAIARAILADKPILILDEATSSLDSITESLIQEAIENLMEGRTTIMIAHRLSTIQKADRILVFDKGKIIEEGTHSELIKIADGQYKELFDKQVMGLTETKVA